MVRELEFLRPLTASILSERRALRPFGLAGGASAAPGVNLWVRRDGREVSLGGRATLAVEGGDRLRILTPGGGGYGPPPEGEAGATDDGDEAAATAAASGKRRRGGSPFTVPVRDGGSVQQYVRNQETV